MAEVLTSALCDRCKKRTTVEKFRKSQCWYCDECTVFINQYIEIVEGPGTVSTAPDPVNHPAHYTSSPSGVECIQVARHMNFNLGNALKYICRSSSKGAPVEDLRKAIWYLQDEIDRLGKTNAKE